MSIELVVALAALIMAFACFAGAIAVGWFVLRQVDHRHRMERRERGLSEVPPDKRKPEGPEPIPEDIQALIDPWHSLETRRGLEADCRSLRKQGVAWSEIRRMLVEQMPAPEPEPEEE